MIFLYKNVPWIFIDHITKNSEKENSRNKLNVEHLIQIHVLNISTVNTVCLHTCVLAYILIKVTDID